MKKLFTAATLAIASVTPAIVCAAESDNYPDMYLRGSNFGPDGQWKAVEEFKFNREGDKYTLHVDHLSGSFKVSNEDWTYNFGADTPGHDELNITGPMFINGKRDGRNIGCPGLDDVTISFSYSNSQYTEISFTVAGVAPKKEYGSGTLPILYINVYDENGDYNNEIISKDLSHKNYFSGEYWLDTNGCEWLEAEGAKNIGSADEPLPLEIKARGNWTRRGFSKKPFKLKLGSKQSLLGLSKSKHFAILAHADDSHGYLRNFTGFNLGQRIGLPWTPSQQPVEVVINGDYRGLYFLTESIRIEKDRVNITELDDNVSDPSLISGGYLVELDNYDEDNQIQLEEKSCVGGHYLDVLRITFDTPEEYSELQRRFVTDQFSAMNDAVGSNSDDLWRYLDLDDAARYYLVEEIICHTESYHGSTYLFRDRGENQKWHFSPLWDCGNAFSGPSDGFFYDHDPFGNTWIPSIRTNNTFNEKVRQTWLWFMNNKYEGLADDINTYISHIAEAAKADHKRWGDAPVPDGGQPVANNSDITSRRDYILRRLQEKVDWLKGKFGDYVAAGVTTEPERDTTPAAPLPEYVGIESVSADAHQTDAPAEYFNLQGIRIATPVAGSLYIERRGSKASLRLAR